MKQLRLYMLAVLAFFFGQSLQAVETLVENTKAYTLKTQRGVLGTQGGYLTCTANPEFKNQGKFAVIRYEGKTYLYSVNDKKFTCKDAQSYDTRNGGWFNVLLSNSSIEPVTFVKGNKFADYPYAVSSNGRAFNTYVNTQKGVCLSGWTTYDAGNQYALSDPVDFNPQEALATLEAFFHSGIEVTYRVYNVEESLLEEQKLSGVDGEVIKTVPTSFVRHAFTIYTVKNPITVSKQGENIVEVEAVFQMPFTTSSDINNAHWYNLTLRSGQEYVNAATGYKCDPNPTIEQLLSLEYQWAFQGDPYDGIVVFNRSDLTKTLCKSGDVAVLGDGIYKWRLVEHANGFLLANNEDGKFINAYQGSGGHLAFWNNANDVNSIFNINEVGIQTSVKLNSSAKARLNLYPAPADKSKGYAMLIIPGGGYGYVAGGTEGADWTPMLGELGYTSAVLTYTTPPTAPDGPYNDGMAALKYLRDNAEVLGIKADKIGVMGFSAGGHLASTIATHAGATERPAFQVLFYPVITMDATYTHQGSRDNLLGTNPSQQLVDYYSNEKQVTADTPQAYICWGTSDRTVPQANSVNYVEALKKAGVAVHQLPLNVGNHGFGFKTDFAYHNQIVSDLTTWLKGLESQTDGIESLPAEVIYQDSKTFYNLTGQRVRNPRHGIYISHGRKFVVR